MLNRWIKAAASAAVVGVLAGVAWAGPREDVQSAVDKLAAAESYSWSATTEGPMGPNTIEGKTQKGGLTWQSVPMRDQTIEIVVKGEKAIIKTEEGWQTAEEAARGDDSGRPGPGRMLSNQARNMKTPDAMVSELLSKATDVRQEGEAFTTEVSGDAAKSLIPMRGRGGGGRGGRAPGGPPPAGADGGPAGPGAGGGPGGGPEGAPPAPPEVKDAKVVAKFWTKDGVLTKVETHMTGVMMFRGEEREIDRTTTTDITNVGATTIDLPEEAQAKLEK